MRARVRASMSRGARQKASDRFKLYVLLWNLEGGVRGYLATSTHLGRGRAKSRMKSPQWFLVSSLGTQVLLLHYQEGKSRTRIHHDIYPRGIYTPGRKGKMEPWTNRSQPR